ncbi:MAG: peptidase S10 [Gammaproteobacteria bacterium]|nr:peptidase S10 [Gammaproteobacteria bacterium]
MNSMSPIVDCGVHYVDVMCQMTRSRPVRVSAIGARLTNDLRPGMYNYGQLQVTFADGSVGWYEAGWGPMMSDVAYFVKPDPKGPRTARPVTFFYNGGPGSSTVWLHMGAFGPKRILTTNDSHTPAAPYSVVANEFSLLDVTDMVFIDAPGTGFSRVAGKDRQQAFYGIDQDAYAFTDFIRQFLGRQNRWNSPKFLFGESYGTTRSALVAYQLQRQSIDLNGVMLLSQILMFDGSADGPEYNPGVNLPYSLALPTYAATAWYHRKLPGEPRDLPGLLAEVEQFATHDYATALMEGAALGAERRQATAEKLHRYTGLPVDYLLKADLRINGGTFSQQLRAGEGVTVGRLDTRFSGPSIDPLSKQASYDPQASAISSAYVAAYNEYARNDLKVAADRTFKPNAYAEQRWDFRHRPPGGDDGDAVTNVMPDLAIAMKNNPLLKVMVLGGYYDLATPYFQAKYEMGQLPIPDALRGNIEFKWFESGHMVYAREADMKPLHDSLAGFIRRNASESKP